MREEMLGFLGPIGGPELVLLFVVFVVLIVVPLGVVLIVLALGKKRDIHGMSGGMPIPPPPLPGERPQARLEELERLKAQGLISSEEFEAKRKKILQDI